MCALFFKKRLGGRSSTRNPEETFPNEKYGTYHPLELRITLEKCKEPTLCTYFCLLFLNKVSSFRWLFLLMLL